MHEDIRPMASAFEALKVSLNQTKEGTFLKIVSQTNEFPLSLLADPVGTRYQIALVRLGDDSAPVPSTVDEAGKRAVKIAGTLCGDPHFQQFLSTMGYADEMSEQAASTYLRSWCKIASRAELNHNAEARQLLSGLREEFVDWLRKGGLNK